MGNIIIENPNLEDLSGGIRDDISSDSTTYSSNKINFLDGQKINKVTSGNQGEILVKDVNGNAINSGKTTNDFAQNNHNHDASTIGISNTNLGAVVPTTVDTIQKLADWLDDYLELSGGGDMLKSTYDTNNSGVVDDSEKLNNQSASYYTSRANHIGTQAISTITNLQTTLDGKANLSGATFTGTISAPNLSNVNSGDETKETIESKLTGTITSHNHYGTYEPANANIQAHIISTSNPHSITASQVGLGNVDNTSDASKNTAVATLTNKTVNLSSNTLTGTKAQFDTACSDGNFLYTGDIIGGDATNNIGYLNIPQNSQSANYTLVLSDAGKHIYHPSADTTARTWTIPANASVAYPIGTAITFINDTSAGVITIAINTDTLVLAGTGTTGSRTLAANGVATAIKITSTRWIINGTGLT